MMTSRFLSLHIIIKFTEFHVSVCEKLQSLRKLFALFDKSIWKLENFLVYEFIVVYKLRNFETVLPSFKSWLYF